MSLHSRRSDVRFLLYGVLDTHIRRLDRAAERARLSLYFRAERGQAGA